MAGLTARLSHQVVAIDSGCQIGCHAKAGQATNADLANGSACKNFQETAKRLHGERGVALSAIRKLIALAGRVVHRAAGIRKSEDKMLNELILAAERAVLSTLDDAERAAFSVCKTVLVKEA